MTKDYEGVQHIRSSDQNPWALAYNMHSVLGNSGYVPLVIDTKHGAGLDVAIFGYTLTIFCITPETLPLLQKPDNTRIPAFIRQGLLNEIDYLDYFDGRENVVVLIIDNHRKLDALTLRFFAKQLAGAIRGHSIPRKGETRLTTIDSLNEQMTRVNRFGLANFERDVLCDLKT